MLREGGAGRRSGGRQRPPVQSLPAALQCAPHCAVVPEHNGSAPASWGEAKPPLDIVSQSTTGRECSKFATSGWPRPHRGTQRCLTRKLSASEGRKASAAACKMSGVAELGARPSTGAVVLLQKFSMSYRQSSAGAQTARVGDFQSLSTESTFATLWLMQKLNRVDCASRALHIRAQKQAGAAAGSPGLPRAQRSPPAGAARTVSHQPRQGAASPRPPPSVSHPSPPPSAAPRGSPCNEIEAHQSAST